MKILILVSMFPPKWLGGTEIATQDIAWHLARVGNDVCVLTSFDKGMQKESKEDNFFVHRISYPKIKFLGVILFWLKCLFLIKKNNPNIVHSQTIQMGVPCFLAKKIFGIPYIVYCHGSDVYLPWKFKKIISKLILENAKAVVVLTEHMKKEVESFKFNIKNIFIIPNGINLEKFKSLSKNNIRKELKISDSEKIVLFVGSLKKVKGIKYLIKAFDIVKAKKQNIKLFLIGDGEQKYELEELSEKLGIKKDIIFLGKLENREIPKYMKACDLFVLPSLSEGLPIVILEAMASGLPIIASNIRGIREIVKDQENGFLIEPKDSQKIAEKILYLFSNNQLIEHIFLNNICKAQNYSWNIVIDKLIKVYNLCLSKD